jgi:hypothetical protein
VFVPEVGMLRDAVEVLRGVRGYEAQPRALRHLAKRFGRDERHVVSAGAQHPSDADERMNIATRSNRCQEKMRHCL